MNKKFIAAALALVCIITMGANTSTNTIAKASFAPIGDIIIINCAPFPLCLDNE